MKIGKVLAAAGGAILVAAFTAQAKASTVYTYTGKNYFSAGIIASVPPDGDYDSNMSVIGSFTLANPIPANSVSTVADVLNFSFFDGRNAITNLNAVNPIVSARTDSNGNIESWAIRLSTDTNLTTIGQQFFSIQTINFGSLIEDFGKVNECVSAGCAFFATDQGSNNFFPGTWSVSADASVVPLPASLPLFATGLGALGLIGWRRKKKAAALAA